MNDLGARVRGAGARRSRTIRRSPRRATRSSASPRGRARGTSSTSLYGEIAEGLTRRAPRARLLDAARRHRRAARQGRRGGAGATCKVLAHRSGATPRRSPRWSALSRARERWHGSHRRLPSAASSRRNDAREREALYASDGADLRRAARPARGRRRRVPRGARARRRRAIARSRALDGLFTRQTMWAELAENLEAQLALAADDEAQLALMLRLAALRESRDGPRRRGHRGLPPGPRARRRPTRRRSPRSSASAATPKHELAIADILEPLYRHVGRLPEAHRRARSAGPPQRRRHAHGRAPPPDRAALRGRGRRSQLGVRHARARAQARIRRTRRRRTAARSRRARDGPLRRSRAASSRRSPRADEDAALASALFTMSARVYETDLGNIDTRDRALPQGARDRSAEPRGRRVARAPLPRRRAVRGAVASSSSARPRSSTSRREEGRALPGRGDRGRRPRAARRGDRRLQQGPRARRRRPPRHRRAHQAATSASRAGRTCSRVYAKKADLVADVEEKKRIYYQVGAVYERELGDVPRAIDTYHEDPRARSRTISRRSSRLDVLYEQRRELAGAPRRAHARERDDRRSRTRRSASSIGSPSSTRSTSTTCRARSSSTASILQRQMPITSRRLRALEGIKGGDERSARRRRRARAGLRGDRASGRSSSASSRCRSGAATIRSRRSTSSTASRASTRTRSATTRRRSRRTRARCRSTTATRRRSANLERLAMVVDRWPHVAALYDARARQARARTPSALRRARPAQRADLRGAARGRRQRDRALPPRRSTVDAENQTAIRALDRLFAQTERWAELAQILAREAEIGQIAGRDPRVQVPPRPGAPDAPRTTSTRRSPRTARSSARRPSTQATLEALEGLFAEGIKQVEIGEILEPLYQRVGRVGEARRASTRRSSRTHARPGGAARRRTTASPSSHEEKLIDSAKTLDVYIRALKEYPLDEKSREEVAAPRRLRSTAAGRRSRTRTPTSSASTPSTEVQTVDRQAPRARRSRTSSATSRRPRRRTATSSASTPLDAEALANLDRIYTSLEQSWPELAQILEQRVQATQRARSSSSSSTLASARSTKSGSATSRDAIRAYRRDLRRARQDARRRDRTPSRASTSSKGAWTELDAVYRARARERRRATSQRRRSARRSRTSLADQLGRRPTSAIETWKRVLDLRGEDPGGARARSRTSTSGSGSGRELVDVLERQFDIAPSDDDRVERPHAARAALQRASSSRDDSALDDWNRVLDIDYANLGALRAIAGIWRRAGRRATSSSTRSTSTVDRARGVPRRRGAQGDLPRARQDVRQQTCSSRSTRPKRGASCSRSARDFEAMDALEAIYRAEEQWTDVIDVKMRRAEALDEPAEQDRRAPRGRRRSGATRSATPDKAHARPTRRSSRSTRRTTRRSSSSRSSTRRRRAGSRSSSSISRASRRAKRPAEKTEILRKIARVFEEKLDDKGQAFDALVNALSRWTSTIARPLATSSAWRRPRAAGPRSSRRSTAGCKQQTEPEAEDPALPAPRQVVRRRPRAPRVRAALLRADHPARSATTSARCARWRASTRRRPTGSRWARRSRAPSTSRPTTSIARRS